MLSSPFFYNFTLMDVYTYIAESNPSVAVGIVEHFGYKNRSKNLAQNLRDLVLVEGEEAVKIIMNNHPDRDYFESRFSADKPHDKNCDCIDCKVDNLTEKFNNANGETSNSQLTAKSVENNFSLIFLAGVMAVSFAILSK